MALLERFLADADLNGWMVRLGHAVAYRQFSTEYVPAEHAARSERLGLWQGALDRPWDWRRGDRRVLEGGRRAVAVEVDRGECNIKGNISRSGERIYHVPGQQNYERTRVPSEMLESGRLSTVNELAEAGNINASYVAHVLRLTLLAPDVVEAILDGRQPPTMQLQPLIRKGFPVEWTVQRSFFAPAECDSA